MPAWRRLRHRERAATTKVKLIYQVSKGSLVGGLQARTKETPAETEAYVDTATCRNPGQVVEEGKFYSEFPCGDTVCPLDRHARMRFPTAKSAYKSEDLKVVEYEYEYDGTPPACRDKRELT